MMLYFDPDGTVAGLQNGLRQAAAEEDVRGLLVLCCDDNGFEQAAIDPILQQAGLPLAGGVFPKIIHAGKLQEKGTLVIGLPETVVVRTVDNLSDPDADYEAALTPDAENADGMRTIMVFVDGFATRLSAFIQSLFNVFGLDCNYVGGGAGSLSMTRKPCVLTNDGMLPDAAVLAFLATESGIGVCHGYRELVGPFQVTEVVNNVIKTIEWQPAFELYRRVLQENAGAHITREDFYATAQHYPFGIARLNGEQIVRDPYLVTADGSLVCVGEVEEGAFLSILHAGEKQLVEAAAEALRLSLAALPEKSGDGLCFFVDCVSRIIALGDRFQKEIDTVSTTGRPLVGICSIGEIANCGTEYLDLYNKTAVMAVLART